MTNYTSHNPSENRGEKGKDILEIDLCDKKEEEKEDEEMEKLRAD